MADSKFVPSFLDKNQSFSSRGAGGIPLENWARLMHPEDRAAIAAMEGLPAFSIIMKWVLSGIVEKIMYGQNIGNCLKLGPKQLAEYYNLLLPVCEKLGIQEIPELYMEMNPVPNALTCGEKRVFIRMTSGLLESFSPEDVQIVLAHECGHILFKHVRYLMLARALMMGMGTTLGQMASIASLGGMIAFEQCVYRWMRMSEYSADRVALLYAGNMKKALSVIVRLAGGPDQLVKNVNYDTYLEQAEECEKVFSAKDIEGYMQNLSLWSQTHPFNASRGYQMKTFSATTNYKTAAKQIGTFCCPVCAGKMRTDNICTNGHVI